jgi:predicted metal-dependent phosphoesterase TrpH
LAWDAGLRVLGLVDHDSTDGVADAQATGAALGVTVVPGVEINTDLAPALGGEAHMLGYYLEYEQPELQQSLRTLRDARERRGERMVARLRDLGLDITWERVRELAGGAVGRPHLARALMEKGYATSVSDAFEKFLVPGRPAYVPRYKVSPEDAIRLIRSAHGVPVLAHPAGISRLAEELLPMLVAVGLQGLECYYGQYDDATLARLLALAERFGLVPTGGSDYHGPNMHPTPLGGRYVPETAFERLRRTAESNIAQPTTPFALPTPSL